MSGNQTRLEALAPTSRAHAADRALRPGSVWEMRSRSNSGVRLDGYARLVQQTILCYQVRRDRPHRERVELPSRVTHSPPQASGPLVT